MYVLCPHTHTCNAPPIHLFDHTAIGIPQGGRGPRRFQQNSHQASPFMAPFAGVQIKRELPDGDEEIAGISRPSKLARLSPDPRLTSDVSMADYSNSDDNRMASQPATQSLTHQADANGGQMESKYRIGSFPVIDRGPVLDGDNAEPIEEEILQESSTDDSAAMSVASQSFSLPTLVIETQPPIEVRTRTPSEKRNFTCGVMVMGPWREAGGKFVGVELLYAPQCREGDEMPKQNILGGTKNVTIKSNGFALFDNLSMSEASTKHKEKEFCLRFTLLDKNGNKMPFSASTTPFYAFSNTKVLSRRREIALRTMSKNYGPFQGGEVMHVIGSPFIRGPSLKLIFRTPHGDVPASGLELYSETVLFFTLPAYPYHFAASQPEPSDGIKVQVMVTNDGRNYSNPLDFTYTPSRKALRSYL